MLIRLFHEGGTLFMSLVLSMWIIATILVIIFVSIYYINKDSQMLKRINDSILFFGSLAFLIGITGQMVGLREAFHAIQRAGDTIIDPRYIAGGFKVTLIAPIFGMTLLILSAILWFVFRSLQRYPSLTEPKNSVRGNSIITQFTFTLLSNFTTGDNLNIFFHKVLPLLQRFKNRIV